VLTRLLRTSLRPYRRLLAAVVLFQAVQALALLYLPSLNADIIDEGVLAGDDAAIRRLGLVMLGATVVQVVFAVAAVYCGARVAMSVGRDIRSDLFHRVTDFSAREVGLFGSPSLITRITNDVQQVQMLVVMTCTLAVAGPITVVGGIVLAVRQDVGLSWLLVIALPALAISVGLVVARMVPIFRRMQERIDRANGVLREQITGVRVVRAFVREPDEAERFGGVNDGLTATSLQAGRLMALMFPTLLLIINVSSVAVVWVGAGRIDAGDMSVGSLVAFLTYFTLILMNVMMAMFVAIMAPRAAVCAERIVEVFDTEPSVVAPADPVVPSGAGGSLTLRDVGFRYPGADAPVLDGISFASAPGQTTAIVGSTGAGKTTLVNLVSRLVDVTSGAIEVDGVDIRAMAPDDLWARVGIVPQRPYLFSGTVASNLRYGKPDATDDELWEALRVAQADDFVAAMPRGLDAPITQGGTNVSGGQRQRLAIARALVKKPAVYLFDDSFSALDLATDARLRAALAPHVAGATVVIVAQRVSTIRTADQILVLEDGRQVGLGTHDELLRTCPTYHEIVASQVGEREAA
jgi:ATP-binding cassette subfamily B protein